MLTLLEHSIELTLSIIIRFQAQNADIQIQAQLVSVSIILPNSTLIFDVELVNVQKPIAYKPFSGKGKDTVKLSSGLKYIVIDKGNPKLKAQLNQTASIYYAGYLMDGTKFDGNFDRFEPINVPVTGAGMIKGWQEMLPRMNKGMKVRVIIPPALAYGAQGYPGVIPENATIIFDMFLSDLK